MLLFDTRFSCMLLKMPQLITHMNRAWTICYMMTNNRHDWFCSCRKTPWYKNYNMNTWRWTHEHGYEHESLNGMNKGCVKHVLEITWESGTWWSYGLDKDMVAWLFLVLARIIMFYNKIWLQKWQDTRLIWGKLMVKTEEVYIEYPYLCIRYDGVITLSMSLCDMGYWWAHYDYILIIPGMTSRWDTWTLFPLTVSKQR